MHDLTPIVFVPGVVSSLRSHLPILPGLWRHGSVTVANQTRDDSIAAMAARVLREAPPTFALLVHPSRLNDAHLQTEFRLSTQEAGGAATFRRQQIAVMARIDQRPHLPAIKVPTLVLSGDEDRLISNAYSQEMAGLIPKAALVIVPRAGHMAPIEQPEAVTAALDTWFAA